MTGLDWLFSGVFVVALSASVASLQRWCDRRFGVHEPGLLPADRPVSR
jgi:hypothetical protein